MKTTIEQLKERIAALEAEVARLKGSPAHQHHYHYHWPPHWQPQPPIGAPAWTPGWPLPIGPTCVGSVVPMEAQTFQLSFNGGATYGPEH